jgi:hypothetical protein
VVRGSVRVMFGGGWLWLLYVVVCGGRWWSLVVLGKARWCLVVIDCVWLCLIVVGCALVVVGSAWWCLVAVIIGAVWCDCGWLVVFDVWGDAWSVWWRSVVFGGGW